MNFKEWFLLNEGGVDWDLIFPVRANEYPDVARSPRTLWIWKEKMKSAKEKGKPLINIDYDNLTQNRYVTVSSRTLPDNKPWIHKKDNNSKSSLKINNDLELYIYGQSDDFNKKFSKSKNLDKIPLPKNSFKFDKNKLNKLFGDDKNIKPCN
jgi:hypothetical protein